MDHCDLPEKGMRDLRGVPAHGGLGLEGLRSGEGGRTMRYLFGDYVLDTQRAELHGAGAPLKVRRKVLQVLAYLLAHRDRVVSKHELLEHLWPDQFVGDEVLKTCITALRKALGERGRAPRFVRTLHGQGYRFVAAVEVREHRPADEVPPALPRHPGEDTTHQAEAPSPALAPPLADLGSTPVEVHDGEHKQLTVLCGALAEVPSLTARLGPEGLYRLLQAWLALVQEVVQHYDGTLTLSAGEGLRPCLAPQRRRRTTRGGPCWRRATSGSAARPPCPSTPPETSAR